MKLFRIICLVLSFIELLVCGQATPAECTSPSTGPDHWAQPVRRAGVPNLHRVSTALYRSAQPTVLGMKELKKMGIKTIVNLRSLHSDRHEIGNTSLAYEHIPMLTWYPREDDLVRFLKIVVDPERNPVLVHCQHGADRTGLMCAVYRVAVDGWTKEEAIREMTKGGFGFHWIWRNLIWFIRDLDINAVKQKAGL